MTEIATPPGALPDTQPGLVLTDPVALARVLLACRSDMAGDVPRDGGAQAALAGWLEALGFDVTSLPFGPEGAQTPNLFARRGTGAPHLCFAGHTDVVPPGDDAWRADPFAGSIADGEGGRVLIGRGAVDMKGAIAAFVAAVARSDLRCGTVSLLITGDEEGPARDGTVRVVHWMRERGIVPDGCIVGEPTNPSVLGEVIKNGRRGSLNATITAQGVQGHVAYPHLADNPVHRLLDCIAALRGRVLDAGSADFAPSSLQFTTIDVGNPAGNVIPARARARLNIRFNNHHTGAALGAWINSVVEAHGCGAEIAISGEAFRTPAGGLVEVLADAVAAETGRRPRLDTGGGTSDARFIASLCPVAEFGLVGATMHKTDEQVPLDDLERLSAIYARLLERFLAPAAEGAR